VLRTGEAGPTLARRARAGAEAYHAGLSPWVIAAGGRRWHGRAEAHAIAFELERSGVPRQAIIAELWSLNTTENAIFTASILRALGATGAVIATSAWHMRRALANFRAEGIAAEPLALDDPPARGRVRGLFRLGRDAYEAACALRDTRAVRRAESLRKSAEWIHAHRIESSAAVREALAL
jgi:uncharacterized SAM-binding protein YcdF (DUF218 family)